MWGTRAEKTQRMQTSKSVAVKLEDGDLGGQNAESHDWWGAGGPGQARGREVGNQGKSMHGFQNVCAKINFLFSACFSPALCSPLYQEVLAGALTGGWNCRSFYFLFYTRPYFPSFQ